MPTKGYPGGKLTDLEVLELFDKGKYIADLENGLIINAKTFKPLFTYIGSKRSLCPWTRLYAAPKMRSISVSVCIWIVGNRRDLPTGFEVHHDDRDQTNNTFSNLFALTGIDHQKAHGKKLRPHQESY